MKNACLGILISRGFKVLLGSVAGSGAGAAPRDMVDLLPLTSWYANEFVNYDSNDRRVFGSSVLVVP